MANWEVPGFGSFYGVSKMGQTLHNDPRYCRHMEMPVRIVEVEKDGDDGAIVTFSDGTIGAYVVEELLELRPYRESVDKTILIDKTPRRR